MNRKAKGTKGERELITYFNENGWSAIRVAGSGSTKYPAPDILAGNAMRRLAIECKVTKYLKKYIPKAEVTQLQTFSQNFGAEAWVAIRFPGRPWYFLILEDLEDTGSSLAISYELAKLRGLTIEELMKATT
jgi:holliday junction resolvase Hjr